MILQAKHFEAFQAVRFMQVVFKGPLQPKVNNTSVNSLPKDKILDRSKLKAFADDKIHVTKE